MNQRLAKVIISGFACWHFIAAAQSTPPQGTTANYVGSLACRTIEEHTHHKAGSPGDECITCHMPKIERRLGDQNVRSHTFRFISPAMTDAYKIPNPCTTCHQNKTTAWASEQLKRWSNVSPWGIGQ